MTNKKRLFYLTSTLLIALFGGLIYGYDISVISGILPIIIDQYVLLTIQGERIVGVFFFGVIVGSIISGIISDTHGRKLAILLSLFMLTCGLVMVYYVNGFILIFIMRFFLGLGVGILSVAIPLYITELAPDSMRGRFLVVFQLSITIGIVLAYLVNYLIVDKLNFSWKTVYYLLYIPIIIKVYIK